MKKQGVMVLLKKGTKILLLIRKKENEQTHQQGIYLPLGGHVEKGESIIDAAIREINEEANVNIKSLHLRAILYSRSLAADHYDDWVNFLFISDEFMGEARDGNEGKVKWIEIDEISKLNMYEGIKIFLTEVLKTKFLVMESHHNKHELLEYKILVSY